MDESDFKRLVERSLANELDEAEREQLRLAMNRNREWRNLYQNACKRYQDFLREGVHYEPETSQEPPAPEPPPAQEPQTPPFGHFAQSDWNPAADAVPEQPRPDMPENLFSPLSEATPEESSHGMADEPPNQRRRRRRRSSASSEGSSSSRRERSGSSSHRRRSHSSESEASPEEGRRRRERRRHARDMAEFEAEMVQTARKEVSKRQLFILIGAFGAVCVGVLALVITARFTRSLATDDEEVGALEAAAVVAQSDLTMNPLDQPLHVMANRELEALLSVTEQDRPQSEKASEQGELWSERQKVRSKDIPDPFAGRKIAKIRRRKEVEHERRSYSFQATLATLEEKTFDRLVRDFENKPIRFRQRAEEKPEWNPVLVDSFFEHYRLAELQPNFIEPIVYIRGSEELDVGPSSRADKTKAPSPLGKTLEKAMEKAGSGVGGGSDDDAVFDPDKLNF